MHAMRISCLLLVGLAAGCGSVTGSNPDAKPMGDSAVAAGDFTLTVDPTAANVPIASSVDVTVTVARNGMPGDIALTSGGSSDVTVTFASATLAEGTDSTTAKLLVKGGVTADAKTVTITGTAGDKTHSADVVITAQTITVTGKTAANTTVHLVGKAAVTSDASGNFTYTDVTPPYDVYTVSNSFLGNVPTVIYYDDLTTTTPVLQTAGGGFVVFPLGQSGTVSGTKSGTGGTTVSPNVFVWSRGGKQANTGSGSYSFTASWPSGQTSGTLYGLQWTTRPTGAPNAYLGYGETNATLAAGGTTTVNVVFGAPNTAAITGAVTQPSGYPTPTITLSQQFGNNTHDLWVGTTTDATSTIITGQNAGKASLFVTSATGAGETSSYSWPALDAATNVATMMKAAAVLMSPNTAATGIDTNTPFTINAASGAVYRYSISTGGTTKADFEIISTNTTVQIPMTTEVPLPPNQSFTWSVQGFGPVTSVDDAATAGAMEGAFAADYVGPAHFQTKSASRTFTSKP